MEIEDFQKTACQFLSTVVGWQSKIARALDVDGRTVRRWLEAGEVPEWAELKLARLLKIHSAGAFPRDEWILGDSLTPDGTRREYIIHTRHPRFIARIVEIDDDFNPVDSEMPVELIGTMYREDGQLLCEIDWIDEVKPEEAANLLEAALDYMQESDDDDDDGVY